MIFCLFINSLPLPDEKIVNVTHNSSSQLERILIISGGSNNTNTDSSPTPFPVAPPINQGRPSVGNRDDARSRNKNYQPPTSTRGSHTGSGSTGSSNLPQSKLDENEIPPENQWIIHG